MWARLMGHPLDMRRLLFSSLSLYKERSFSISFFSDVEQEGHMTTNNNNADEASV